MRVFVKNQRGQALMPCSQRKARLLLKSGKAKVIGYKPFTIQLLYTTGESTQDVKIGVDTGAKHIGIAIVSQENVLAKGEIELRDGISDAVSLRSTLRRSRRVHNLRYREDRFLNRKRCSGWLPPSVQSKIDATFMWIDKFCNLVPNPELHIEVGKFDVAKMINPNIEGNDYQNGDLKGYFDVRYFVFARDKYTCQVCKKKNKIFNTHHIVYKSKGGTNRADNLITVCTDCHTSENHNPGGVLYNWMIKKKKVKHYKEATFMNIIRKRTFNKYCNAFITYGSVTCPNRKHLELEKTHYNDAIAITGISNVKNICDDYFMIKQYRKKKRSLHETIPVKFRKNKNINSIRRCKNAKSRNGFYMNDMVKFNGKYAWIYGFSGGERYGKECLVRDMDGILLKDTERKNALSIAMKKLKVICHNNNWQYAIVV